MYPTVLQYPQFTDNQVLTSGDLNLLFNYLGEQERLTRTALVGVGIVCGLRAILKDGGKGITITPGCGVSSEGHLLVWEEAKLLRFYKPYEKPEQEGYRWLAGTGDDAPFPVWELTVDEEQGSEALSPGFLSGEGVASANEGDRKVLVLLYECTVSDNKNCDRTNCDDKGETVGTKVRALLVRAKHLERNESREGARFPGLQSLRRLRNRRDTRPTLQPLRLPRWRMANQQSVTTSAVLRSFQAAGSKPFLKEMQVAFDRLDGVLDPFLSTTDRQGLSNTVSRLYYLTDGSMMNGQNALSLSYYFDHLRTLVAAYEELRIEAEAFLAMCLPPAGMFPRHLILHNFDRQPTVLDEARTPWISSPAVNGQMNTRERVVGLYRRLAYLTQRMELPQANELPKIFQPAGGVRPVRPNYDYGGISDYIPGTILDYLTSTTATVPPTYGTIRPNLTLTLDSISAQPAANVRADSPLLAEFDRQFEEIERATDRLAVIRGMAKSTKARKKIEDREAMVMTDRVKQLPIIATPSSLQLPLSERAIPFYYETEDLYRFWNFGDTYRGRSTSVTGYRAGDWGGEKEPLNYELLPHQFLRIEGAVGEPVNLAELHIAKLIQEKGLALDLVSVGTGRVNDRMQLSDTDVRFADLEADYTGLSTDMMGDVLEVLIRLYDMDGPAAEADDPITPGPEIFRLVPSYRVTPGTMGYYNERPGNTATPERLLTTGQLTVNIIINTVLQIGSTMPASLNSFVTEGIQSELEVIQQQVRELAGTIAGWLRSDKAAKHRKDYEGVSLDDFLHLLDLLAAALDAAAFTAVARQYENRKQQLLRSQLLSGLLDAHPGIQPACGAPLGGTYVLVYHGADDSVIREGQFIVSGRVTENGEPVIGKDIKVLGGRTTKTGNNGTYSIRTDRAAGGTGTGYDKSFKRYAVYTTDYPSTSNSTEARMSWTDTSPAWTTER